MGKTKRENKEDRRIRTLENEQPYGRVKKPRDLGSGFHTDKRDRRNNTRSSQLQSEIEEQEEQEKLLNQEYEE